MGFRAEELSQRWRTYPVKPQKLLSGPLQRKPANLCFHSVTFYVSKIYILVKLNIIQNSVNIIVTFLDKRWATNIAVFWFVYKEILSG